MLALVGYLIISGLLGRGTAGAGTPEEAVQAFVAAIQSKDVAAIAASLDPNEERQLVPLVTQVQQTAEAGGVTNKGQQGKELAAIDLKIANVTYDTKNLSERVARVDITGGTVTLAGIDRSKLPLAVQGLSVSPGAKSVNLAKLNTTDGQRVFVMTVKEDRGWFVSPMFTGAEFLAQNQGVLGSYPDALPKATTEKTADQAVTRFLKAAASKDPEAVLARLAPQEQSVLRTYERLWRPALGEAMNTEAWNAVNFQVSVNKMTDTDLGDGSTGVAIDSADMSVSNINGSGTYSLEKDCIQGSIQGRGNAAQCLKTWKSANGGDRTLAQQGGTSARATIVAVKTGDGYAVSLLGSAAATGRGALAALDAKDIFRAIGMEFLLPTGASLNVGQQVTVAASTTDNVTLIVGKKADVVLTVQLDGAGTAYPMLWNPDGTRANPTGSSPEGTSAGAPAGDIYTLNPGQYRITWSLYSDTPVGSKIMISAAAQ